MNILWIIPNNIPSELISFPFINRELISLIDASESENINLFIYADNPIGTNPEHPLNKPIFEYNKKYNNLRLFSHNPTKKSFYKTRHLLQYLGGMVNYPFFWPNKYLDYEGMKWFFKTHKSLERIIKKNKIDIAHTHFLGDIESLIKIKKKYPFLIINTYHGSEIWNIRCEFGIRGKRAEDPSYDYFLKKVLPFIDLHLPVSNWLASCLGDFKLNKKKIKVIYNGINLKEFSQKENKLKSKKIKIVSYKRTKNTFLAFKEAVKHVPNLQLLIVGDKKGDYGFENEEKFVNELGIQKDVIFLGYVDPHLFNKTLNDSDIVLHPSWWDSFSVFCAEAMALGKPIIASGHQGIAEVVENGKTGILIDIFDYKDIAKAIVRLAKDKKLRAKMGKEGRKRVEKYFTNDRKIKEYIQVYKELVNK